METPGKTRPARPDLCEAEAWETHCVVRQFRPCRVRSCAICRLKHRSMTMRTFGRVTDDSAMFEAKKMWQMLSGGWWKACSCSSMGMVLWRTNIRYSQGLRRWWTRPAAACSSREPSKMASTSKTSEISPMPGKKTNTPSPPQPRTRTRSRIRSSKPFWSCGRAWPPVLLPPAPPAEAPSALMRQNSLSVLSGTAEARCATLVACAAARVESVCRRCACWTALAKLSRPPFMAAMPLGPTANSDFCRSWSSTVRAMSSRRSLPVRPATSSR
mmetsp:Transcript_1362/g.5484  ORF Transcript_1362/g.5484 Transcript_1362/m.5484 type:complete len:271 (-) Transcript_1362:1224-2036(-)